MSIQRIYQSDPGSLSRRGFLTTAGAIAVVFQMEALGFVSSLFAEKPKPKGKPTVIVAFIRPEKPYTISWPGGNCDVDAQQALFTKTLRQAAKKLGVNLQVQDNPVWSEEEMNSLVNQSEKSQPDGLILCAMCLKGGLKRFDWIVKKQEKIPSIIYSNVSGFTSHLQVARNTQGVYVAATPSVEWLGFGLRMLDTIWRMKNTRILVVGSGRKEREWKASQAGTQFCAIPESSFTEELKKVETDEMVRSISDFYAKHAKEIVEPTKADILESARYYIGLRRLMEAENCHGISMGSRGRLYCLGPKPVCMAFSKLRDECIVAGCEADIHAALSMRLTHLLVQRPGFQQDPSPNTVDNTLIGAHCTSATKLEGFEKAYCAPFKLRDYHTKTGVAMQVLWPVGKKATVMEMDSNGESLRIGSGRIRSNIPQPPCGLCRTAVELELNDVEDTRDVRGFHQLFILGDVEDEFRAYCKLAKVKVGSLTSNLPGLG